MPIDKNIKEHVYNTKLLKEIRKEDHRKAAEIGDLMWATTDFVKRNPHLGEGLEFRCHSICDALVDVVSGVKVVDGYFLGLKKISRKGLPTYRMSDTTHSWLVTESGTIIDPYPPGTFTPTPLIYPPKSKYKDHGHSLYLPRGKEPWNVREGWLCAEAARLTRIMMEVKSLMFKK